MNTPVITAHNDMPRSEGEVDTGRDDNEGRAYRKRPDDHR